jgi:hypothetical protein
VHEVENFFLHPATLRLLLTQNGREQVDPLVVIQAASDARAGSWIFQYAMATPNAKTLPDMPEPAKNRAKGITWERFGADRQATIREIGGLTRFGAAEATKFSQILEVAANAYARKRDEETLWQFCEGKQVLNAVANSLGFADQQALSQATFALWDREGAQIPEEVLALRQYFRSL